VKLAAFYSVINKVFDLAPPVLIGMAVDTVVEGDASALARMGVTSAQSQLVVIGALTVLIWGLESLFEYLLKTAWRNLAQTIQHDLRLDAYRHVQRLDLGWFEDRSTGRLMSVLNDDINQLERFLDGGANDLLQVGTTVVVVSAAFFWVSPTVAVLAMLPIPLILWGSFRFQQRIAPHYAEVRERASLVNGQLANNISGIETIKSFVTEDREAARISGLSDDYRSANREAIRLSSAFSPLIRMVIVMGFTATLVVGGRLAMEGTLAVGAYSVLVFLTQRLLWPLTRLGATVDQYQRAMASTDRVLELLHTPEQVDNGEQVLPEVRGRIVFDRVSFAYVPGVPVLADFDLRVDSGQTIALVGSTGSGKSTLVRLLLRFHAPQSGQVTLDGVPVDQLSLADLRRSIGLVSQSVYLFAGTVRENIAYGAEDASDDAIWHAAQVAEAADFIRALPNGLDTVIGERGQKLSGGQRQRLSIARAVLKNAPVLVLDEATSAVDNETEASIQRSLEVASQGRTTVVVAHRLSTIRHADRIVVLEGGEIVESGTHADLLALDGRYAALWRVQTGARVEEVS